MSYVGNKLAQTTIPADDAVTTAMLQDDAVTAVDYQYSGSGVGVKDVMYFLSSIYDGEELHKKTEKILNIYFYYLSELLDPKTAEEVEKIGKKIRETALKKVPYMLVVGEKEMETRSVSVRKQGEGDQGSMELAHFVEIAKKESAFPRP